MVMLDFQRVNRSVRLLVGGLKVLSSPHCDTLVREMVSDKFPRIPHLPWSPGGTRDDRRMADVSGLLHTPVIVTEKLDGGNICLCRNAVYARSHRGPVTHPAFDYLKAAHAQIKPKIPDGISVFCEYLYAVHTIEYHHLPSYLMVIAVRDDAKDWWLSWDQVGEQSDDLALPTVPVLGEFNFASASELEAISSRLGVAPGLFGEREGMVVRRAGGFSTDDFQQSVAKWVRAGHVSSDEQWMKGPVRKQKLLIDGSPGPAIRCVSRLKMTWEIEAHILEARES